MFQAGCLLSILIFAGIPFLILFVSLLFSGGMGTFIALGALLVTLIIAALVSQ